MREHTAVIVGAGFSGLCAAILLEKAGLHDLVTRRLMLERYELRERS